MLSVLCFRSLGQKQKSIWSQEAMKKAGVMINLNFQLSENGDHPGDGHAYGELSLLS